MQKIILLITILISFEMQGALYDAPDSIVADTASHILNEVVVVAKETSGVTSASRIDRTAMQHVQPTSFSDLLELLPGNISQDPAMGRVNAITLRETGNIGATGSKTDNDNYAITSLGTQFVVDGSVVGTEANMQTIIGLDSSDPAARRSSVNRGVDMRNISTDNIESVEIIRGIPSVEYGNLTSGVVNIRRIHRATPLTLRFKADGYSKLFSVVKGFNMATDNTFNVDIGYADSKTDPRNNLENYKRLSALAMPTFRFYSNVMSVDWSIGAEFTGSFDNAKVDPDLNLNKVDEYHSSYNRYALTSNLNINLYDKPWIDNIVFNGSVSYENDQLTRRKQVAPSRMAIAPSGYEEGDHDVSFLAGEYIADYHVDGRPFTSFIKLKANGHLLPGNAYKIGAEWQMAKNYGRGQVYDLSRPITAGWSTRPRAFRDIPAMHTLSWFVEDNLKATIGANSAELQIGARAMTMPSLDNRYYLSHKIYIDPRANIVWNFPEIQSCRSLRFHIAGGWGRTTRMPTLDYLYPQCHYNDIIQFSHYDTQNPSNSMVNVRTYKVDVANYDLRAATNTKWEIRAGASSGNNKISVTYFRETMNNGFRYTPIYNSYDYRRYDAETFDAANRNIQNLPYTDERVLDGFRTVSNGTRIYKQGIEYTVQTQRFKPLCTSLVVNGAWFRSTYSNSQALYSPVTDVVGQQAVSDIYVGIYDTNDGRVNEQFNTNFLFDTQIPRWGLIFTTNIQCMWYIKTTRLAENGVPTAYVSAADGLIYPYDANTDDPLLRHLVKTYNDDSFRTFTVPTAVYVNLKASKQLGRILRLSAFVNRIIDYLPDYKSNGLTIRRNSDAYFGMEAVFTL